VAIVTATKGLRMRTEPSLGSESERYKPLLPEGTDLYVISGPKHGSGYHWYEVVPIAYWVDGLIESSRPPEGAYTGWVAVAGRDGEPWLGHRKVTCPAKPKDTVALGALSAAEQLTCLSGVPITVRARILDCNCSATGPCDVLEPAWFWVTGEYLVIVPPATRTPPAWPYHDAIPLVLDPKGRHPDPLQLDKVVTVTGMFNHPAAAKCQANLAPDTPGEPLWVPSGACRTTFVVTSIK
jgi:hypothetical protein